MEAMQSELTIAQKIKAIRKKRGYTQQKLSELSGIKAANIRKYESGTIANPTFQTLEKLSTALSVPIFVFISEGTDEALIKEWDAKVRNFLQSDDDVFIWNQLESAIYGEFSKLDNITRQYIQLLESNGYYINLVDDEVKIMDKDKKSHTVSRKAFMSMIQYCRLDMKNNMEKLLRDYDQ